MAAEIIAAARAAGRRVVVDPKGADYSLYRGASVLKPNRRELGEATRRPVGSEAEVIDAARALIGAHGFGAVLVLAGKDGMLLVEAARAATTSSPPRRARSTTSPAPATRSCAVLAAALAAGAPCRDAARLANVAAGIVVGKVGTAAVVPSRADRGADRPRRPRATRKVCRLRAGARPASARWRRKGLTVGFTNGCFDLLHPGHVRLLSQARAACDRLVVGLNSDASVARLKGPSRPVQNETARAAVLASLASVDLVVVFEESTPHVADRRAASPTLLVKGADYRHDQVVGAEFVEAHGGKVMLAELLPGYSTTATIARMAR